MHYRLLKFYMEHGIKVGKIHRVIEFKQSTWLQSYIKKNQDLRAVANNDFEKDFFKLMNNSVYGKTCENQKNRADIKLITNEKQRKRLCEKPHCDGFRIFGENLAGVKMKKVQIKIDKPFYAGFCVLELSKLHMYKFHYDHIQERYKDKAHLIFTDTDSLMYEIETEDAYQDM